MSAASAVFALFFFALIVWAERGRAKHYRAQNATLSLIHEALLDPNRDLRETFSERLKLLESDIEGLPRKWEAIKRESAAAETRARYHARRALDELEERGLTSPGLEAVASELFEVDGDRGELQRVQPVSESVESRPETHDYIELARMRKYGN